MHSVSAYLTSAGLTLAQCKTDDKSNGITAIPELLQSLDLTGATVTIDAMGCQTEIAKTIVAGGGNYILSVKENQPTLRKELATTFTQVDYKPGGALEPPVIPLPAEQFTENDKGHGRAETRTVDLCRDLHLVSTAQRWEGCAFVARVTRERTVLRTGKQSTEVAYYIGSDPQATAEGIAKAIRDH